MDYLVFHNRFTNRSVTGTQILSDIGSTDWICISGQIGIQITGTATTINAVVERSSLDPAGDLGANPAPVDDDMITGSPADGIVPAGYYEPGTAWWRVRVTLLSGGPTTISLTGLSGVYL